MNKLEYLKKEFELEIAELRKDLKQKIWIIQDERMTEFGIQLTELKEQQEKNILNIDANRDQINANLEGIEDCWKLLKKIE